MLFGRIRNRNWILYLINAATFIVGAAFFMMLIKQPVNNYTFDISAASPDVGRIGDEGYYFDLEHAGEVEKEQKIFLHIPMEVKKGSYTLRVKYMSGAASEMSVTSMRNPWAVKCDRVALTHVPKELPGEFNMNYGLNYLPGFASADMYITRDVNDLDVYMVYCGFQSFNIKSVELIGNRKYVKTIFPVFILILVAINLVAVWLLRVAGKPQPLKIAAVIVLIALLSSIPLLFKIGLYFDDGQFIYGKILGLADGLKDKQFPVRIHPNSLQRLSVCGDCAWTHAVYVCTFVYCNSYISDSFHAVCFCDKQV